MKEKLFILGYADYKIIDHFTGKVLKTGRSYNMVVNDGLERLSKIANGLESEFTKIAIGTDNTPPAEGQSALVSQHEIKDASCGYEANYKTTWEGTFTFVSGVTIREAGVFTADSKMLDRVIFSDEACGADKDFHIKITLEFARA